MKLLEVEGARAPVLHIAGDATGVDACDLHRQRCCTFHGRCTKPSATMLSTFAAARVWNMLYITGDHVIAVTADFQACID